MKIIYRNQPRILAFMGVLLMLMIGCDINEEFMFPPPDTIADVDGNMYHIVKIGTQVWMAENLKTTKLNDGTYIPLVISNDDWGNLSSPGYCWYNNDAANNITYGALYNFYAVRSGKLAPAGWHVPTDADWTTLVTFLDGDSVAGGKLKEAGTTHWLSPNKGATNEFGFTALPGGYRADQGNYSDLGSLCIWWSSTIVDTTYGYARFMNHDLTYIIRFENSEMDGLSVRCVKD